MAEPAEVTFDLPTMVLHMVAGATAREQELALGYWGHYVDEQGRLKWAHRAADIASGDSALPGSGSLLKVVRAVTTVECKFVTCRTCGETYRPDARSHMPEVDVFNQSWAFCPEHLAEEKVKREAENELRRAKNRAEECERATVKAAAKAAAEAAANRAAVARASAAPPELSQPKPSSYADHAGELTWDAVQELFARPRDSAWAEDALMLTRLAITHEAERYYEYRVGEGDLLPLTAKGHALLNSILFEHSTRTSIGQYYALLWWTSRDDNAITARKRAESWQEDSMFTLNYRLKGWLNNHEPSTLDFYHRVGDLADATEALFHGLSLDPMTATPTEIADAVQSQLDTKEVALNAIVRGVSLEQCDQTWINVAALHSKLTQAAHDGADLGENTGGFLGFLGQGLWGVFSIAENSGCNKADAFRSAYFGVGCLDTLTAPFPQIGAEIQRFVRESVDGTADVDAMFETVMTVGWPALPTTPPTTPPASEPESSSFPPPALTLVR